MFEYAVLCKCIYKPSFTWKIILTHEYAYCYCSVAKSCPTLCDPHSLQHIRLSSPSQSLRVCSNSCPLNKWCYLAHILLPLLQSSIFPSIRQGLFQWVGHSHQVAKVLEFQLQQQSFQWVFRVDFLYDWLVWSPCCPRDSQVFSSTTIQKN